MNLITLFSSKQSKSTDLLPFDTLYELLTKCERIAVGDVSNYFMGRVFGFGTIKEVDKKYIDLPVDIYVYVVYSSKAKQTKRFSMKEILQTIQSCNLDKLTILMNTGFVNDERISSNLRFLICAKISEICPELSNRCIDELPLCYNIFDYVLNKFDSIQIDTLLTQKITNVNDKENIKDLFNKIKRIAFMDSSFSELVIKLLQNNCFLFLSTCILQFDGMDLCDIILKYLDQRYIVTSLSSDKLEQVVLGFVQLHFYKGLASVNRVVWLLDTFAYQMKNLGVELRIKAASLIIDLLWKRGHLNTQDLFNSRVGFTLISITDKQIVDGINQNLSTELRTCLDKYLVQYLETHENIKQVKGHFLRYICQSTCHLIESSDKINRNPDDIFSIHNQMQIFSSVENKSLEFSFTPGKIQKLL